MAGTNSSVSRCFRMLVRMIHASALQAGDHLPIQRELRKTLSASNATVSAAMSELTQMGVVVRKHRTGTVIADLSPLEHIRWSVGILTIVAPEQGPAAFFAHLHHHLAAALSRIGCACATYVRRETPHWRQQVEDFPGLAQDLDAGRLDALIDMTHFHPDARRTIEAGGIPMCHVGPDMEAPCGALIDLPSLEVEAERALSELGCRRIAGSDIANGALAQRIAQSPTPALTVPRPASERIAYQPGIPGGRHLAETLRSRPPDQRPDGIVIPDDYAAMAFTRELAPGDYRPRVAVLTNRGLPLPYALPVIQFELDMDELVRKAVDVTRSRIMGRIAADHVEWVAPRKIDVSEIAGTAAV